MNTKPTATVAALLLLLTIALPLQALSAPGQPTVPDKPLPAPPPTAVQNVQSTTPGASVLERFRTYSGPRTPAALIKLFAAPVAANIHQQPEVVMSDGATPVRILIVLNTLDNKSPNVALNGAQLISIKRSKPDELEIEALPTVGILKSSLIMLTDSATVEIPLTVAPTLPKETDLTEPGFVSFLREVASSKLPLFDLNDDGRHDYVDDYIFTANFLARPNLAAADQGAVQPADPNPAPPEVILEQQATPVSTTGDPSPPAVSGQTFTTQGSSGSKQPPPPTTPPPVTTSTTTATSTMTTTTTPPLSTEGLTPYQRNQAIRNQRIIDMKKQLTTPPVTP